jgi:hypothetical protein
VLRYSTIAPDTGLDDQLQKPSKQEIAELLELEGSKVVINTGKKKYMKLLLT